MARRRIDLSWQVRSDAYRYAREGQSLSGGLRLLRDRFRTFGDAGLRQIWTNERSRFKQVTDWLSRNRGQFVNLANLAGCPPGSTSVRIGLRFEVARGRSRTTKPMTREVIIPAIGRVGQLEELATKRGIKAINRLLEDYDDVARRLGTQVQSTDIHYIECL